MIAKGGYVYIISNRKRNVLYTGVTNNLYARISQHKQGVGSAWAKNYRCTDLVYYEFHESIEVAIQREKQIKKWKREYKDNIIVGFNPGLLDLYDQVEEMQ